MRDRKDASAIKELRQIPGVGPSIAQDLIKLGIYHIQDLIEQDPEELYEKHCIQKGGRVDRCILYVFRCAVYFASNEAHDPQLLKWWNWKEK